MTEPVTSQSQPAPSAAPVSGGAAAGPAEAEELESVLAAGPTALAAALGPVLVETCAGKLSDVRWFRTDWQRGGAATGFATFHDDAGAHPAVIKLPVRPRERQWLERLQPYANVAPKLYASGDLLGGYDVAWVVMERLPHGPLGKKWGGAAFDLVIEAAGRFYAASEDFPVRIEPPKKNWDKILDTARAKARRHSVANEQRWGRALKGAHKLLKEWLSIWRDRPVDEWCHGDLHLGNAMSRTPAPQGPAILLDYAELHAGNWLEDAVYFEHIYWSRPDLLDGRKICAALAHERKRLGLKIEEDWPRLASVRRALLAMSTPAMLEHDGAPQHVAAALEVLEREVG